MSGRARRRRVPVVRQNTMTDCGAACLTMVLRHHGLRTTLREVGGRIGPSRDGTTARALVAAAREYGLAPVAMRIAPDGLGRVALPAIAHWRSGHFVVVERHGRRGVEVADPARGRLRLTREEFAAGFTGVVIVPTPGPGFRPGRIDLPVRPWRRRMLLDALRRSRGLVALVVLASVLLQALGLVLPLGSGLIVDRVLPSGSADPLPLIGAGVAVAAGAQLALGLARVRVLAALQTRVDRRLTTETVRHLFALPYRFFALRGTGDLVARAEGVTAIRELATGQVLPAMLDGPLAVVYIALVMAGDRVLGLCLLGIVAAHALLLFGTRRRTAALAQRQLAAQAEAQGRLIESIRGVESLKAMSAERRVIDRWAALFEAQLDAAARGTRAVGGVVAAQTSLHVMTPMVLLWAGAWRVLGHDMTLGTLLALNAVALAAITPLNSLMSAVQRMQVAGAAVRRLADILDTGPEPGAADEPRLPELQGAVELRGVGFRYDPRGAWTVREVSLLARPGQKIALVGRSGSGKSTLARIMLGLYAPEEGEVRYDGVAPPAAWTPALRRRFGVVTQEPALFSGTIRDNIALGDPDAPLEQVVAAARLACVHDEIARMPLGYDTPLPEGHGLSGGQRQRIALARALLSEPRLLVLDEATSHLDTATEAAIEARLSGLRQTRIVVAHRLSTVRDADLILVLRDGRIVEQGGHAELLALGGEYATLVGGRTAPGVMMGT
ncbi:peptidase C39 [Sphaerisporangium siamense]|uniref:ABC-type bacteriocin/lantibiotic exporter with double-glycine peptidase domain n=1 Tax=Sphaerisporangium siamense TaxID=795645 RepID=A0A7W7GBR5_9ACTN|nr:peptidase domain-containing ABC transporter [Sphaerisporangium siamense]MBB4701261.1 ABC-type bacteriocin/lantibiotic exporter with double-glycine peptidase domain [Sphaerisporangium siamense]GII87371.1 peptidase C39 [Sphaerisporangium siamense]